MVIKKLKTLILILICGTCGLYSTHVPNHTHLTHNRLEGTDIQVSSPIGSLSNAALLQGIFHAIYLPFMEPINALEEIKNMTLHLHNLLEFCQEKAPNIF